VKTAIGFSIAFPQKNVEVSKTREENRGEGALTPAECGRPTNRREGSRTLSRAALTEREGSQSPLLCCALGREGIPLSSRKKRAVSGLPEKKNEMRRTERGRSRDPSSSPYSRRKNSAALLHPGRRGGSGPKEEKEEGKEEFRDLFPKKNVAESKRSGGRERGKARQGGGCGGGLFPLRKKSSRNLTKKKKGGLYLEWEMRVQLFLWKGRASG